ncbi:hypothetical protein GCM10010430_24030 [Kitasatospora cystarginea]|uniref:Uncharacterized protein n=1 Tax=Kitasatospora cystarginea TaxID=58350 RepID=A0ABN3DU04_9ACTN
MILITVLLRSATRGPRPVESLLTPALKAMLFVSLVFLLVEVYDLSELLGHFHPVHPRRDCDL